MDNKVIVSEEERNEILKKISNRKIFYDLVNIRRQEYLSQVPYSVTPDGEYAFCYRVLLHRNREEIQSFRINHRIADMLQMDADMLQSLAMKNTPELFPAVTEKLGDIMLDLVQTEEQYIQDESLEQIKTIAADGPEIFVLTNENICLGAVAMYYDDKSNLRKLADTVNSNLYVIPFSVHEVILVPEKAGMDREYLSDLVQYVNKTEVSNEEILGDNLLYFDRNSNDLLLAKKAVKLKELEKPLHRKGKQL